MDVDPGTPRSSLDQIHQRLEPKLARSWALARLDELFRSGSVPDPAPEGFQRGRLVATSISSPVDVVARRIASLYMPWLGKSFDATASEGVNILRPSAKTAVKALWPSYTPEGVYVDRLEVFPFKTYVDAGAIDADVKVLKIDYDFDVNPGFIIRRILDELVQIDDSLYLGKILYRYRSTYRLIGYFSLEK